MTTGWRAAVAVSMLAGFYVLAFAVIGGFAFAAYYIATHANGGTQIVLALLAAAAAIVVGLVKALKRPPFTPHGVPLHERDQPHLWAMVRDLSERVVTGPPDEIWLVPEVNAAVTEDASLLGLRSGRRYMLIGLPLLLTMNADQMRAILGHELGHYSHAHTRLGEINYRGRITIGRTIEQLRDGGITRTIVRKVFELYARLYFLVENTVSRQQELEADQAAAAVAGRHAIQTALRELPVLLAAWNFYLKNYVTWALDYGIAPRGVFAGFPRMLQARHGELSRLRGEELDERTSRWDTHPSTPERIAALQGAPEIGTHTDPRPAWRMLAGIERLMVELEEAVLDFGDRQLLDWSSYTAQGVLAAEQRRADGMYRALSRVTGRTPESFETILRAAEAGRFGELYDLMVQANAPQGGLVSVFTIAAIRSGMVRVEHRWDRSPRLLFADGEEFDIKAVLETLESGPNGATRVRAWLRKVGIDIALAAPRQARADASGANVVGAMANVKVGKDSMDLLITDEGLVFTPCPKATDQGKKRLTELIGSQPVAQLAARPENLWIPFEEIASATMHRMMPLKAALALHNGSTYDIQETLSGEELGKSSDTLRQVMQNLGARTAEAGRA
ncbi:M48 family metallopeptidase [Actinopolymorpha sp. B11F2]|uniref:M48 family metallopeptidase n=1 Tax=Actinopolymorpha sp. B11F2 TaxID=3160862 RepID=UPI0032E48D1C